MSNIALLVDGLKIISRDNVIKLGFKIERNYKRIGTTMLKLEIKR